MSDGEDTKRAATGGRVVSIALVVVAVSALAAIATTGAGVLETVVALDERWTRAVRIAGGAAMVAGVIALLMVRRAPASSGLRGANPTAEALVRAAAIMALVAMIALLRPPAGARDGAGEGGGMSPPGGNTISRDAPPSTNPPPPPEVAPITEGYSNEGSILDPEEAPATPPPAQQSEPTAPEAAEDDSAGDLRSEGSPNSWWTSLVAPLRWSAMRRIPMMSHPLIDSFGGFAIGGIPE